jgi:cytochrome c556
MNRLTRIGVAATLAAVSAVAVSQAVTKAASEADATKAVEARQAIFEQIKELNDPIAPMLRPNGPPVDTALVATNSAKIAEMAAKLPAAFLVDTRGFTAAKTRAVDGIWNSQADFKSKADALVTAANAAAEAGKTGDAAATRRALAGIGRACGSCHDTFRGPAP